MGTATDRIAPRMPDGSGSRYAPRHSTWRYLMANYGWSPRAAFVLLARLDMGASIADARRAAEAVQS